MTDAAPDASDAADASEASVAPIAHEDLAREHLPHPRAPFDDVVRFAYTFDGYAALGMQLCGEMGNRAKAQWADAAALPAWLTGDLERLRACLFFEARRWIVLEREPDTRTLMYVHELIRAVEDLLRERDDKGRGAN